MKNKVAKRPLPQSRRVAEEFINDITDKFRKILVIRFSSIGDVVLTNPVLKIVGEKYKNATVNYLTKSKFRSLVEFHPTVSNIITLEDHSSLSQLRNSIKITLPQSRRVAEEFINDITDKFRKILVIRFSSIGDVVLTNPILKIIGERYKNATVNYLTKSKFRSLVEFHPTVSNIINLEEHSSLTQLRNSIKKSEYDLIIDLHNSMRSKLITFGLKNVKRYKKHKIQRYFLTKFKIRIGEFLHVTQKYLEAINVKEKINSFKIFLPPDEKIRDNLRDKFQQLKKSKSVLGISVGASKPSKMFPIHKLIDIINSVGSNFDKIVFFGNGESENELTKTISDRINFKSINLCSKLTISELMLFVNELTVFIGNDSGIAHISAGTGVNTIAFFGQTVPEYGFTPIGNVEIIEPEEELSCRPCGHLGHDKCPKKHHYCMETMSSEKIVNKIKKFNL